MGTRTDGEISYGILIDEDTMLPWSNHDDISNWWLEAHGYKSPFQIFDGYGNWLNGVQPPDDKINEYYAHRREFMKENPIPIVAVNYCSRGEPMYILAIPDFGQVALRGYPVKVNIPELEGWENDVLLEFCKTYKIEHEDGPAWYLSSFWG